MGRLYGSMSDGAARRLGLPRVTHPGDHTSTAVCALLQIVARMSDRFVA